MKFIFFLTAFFSLATVKGQVDWGQTKNWKIYALSGKKAFSITTDSLKSLRSISLDDESMHTFLKNASAMKDTSVPIFMGFYLTTCELKDKSIRKIIIATYNGGFFYDASIKQYFELPADVQDKWLDYLMQQKTKM